MTYRELLYKATRLINHNQITLGEYEEMTKPLNREVEQESRWIPTSERQPEKNGNYLAFYRSSDGTATLEFMMVDHCNAGGEWLHEESERKSYKKVIAWMPLPKVYNEGKE